MMQAMSASSRLVHSLASTLIRWARDPQQRQRKNCNGANGYITPGEHSVQQKTCIRNEKILKYFGSEMRAIS
jgi:hypothetical protein